VTPFTCSDAPVYCPEIFDVADIEQAKRIILTPQPGTTTEERWEKETIFLADQIGMFLKPDENSIVLDYGCGIGRIAKALIGKHRCRILGVDISTAMRRLAPRYVRSSNFSVCTPEMLDVMVEKGLSVDHVYAVWVFQHCLWPEIDLLRIRRILKPGGLLYILNNHYRVVPTNKGWVDDCINLKHLLRQAFDEIGSAELPAFVATPELSRDSFIRIYRKPMGDLADTTVDMRSWVTTFARQRIAAPR